MSSVERRGRREDGKERERERDERKNLGEEPRRNRGWASNDREIFPSRKGVFGVDVEGSVWENLGAERGGM